MPDLAKAGAGLVGAAAETGGLYVSAVELKATLSLSGQTFADPDVNAAISAASRSLDAMCGRRFWADPDTTSVRLYTPDSYRRLMIDDLIDLSALKVDQDGDGTFEETWTVGTDFMLEPPNAPYDKPVRPYESAVIRKTARKYFPVDLEQSVQVTGRFGWIAVPPEIEQAATILAAQLLKRSREAPFGIVAFGGLDAGGAIRIARTDPTIANLVTPYIRHTPFLA